MNLARIGNKYLADTEPWKVAKTDMDRTATILHIALQIAANLSIAFEPFLPFSSAKLRQMLSMDSVQWEELGNINLLKEGQELGEVSLLFEKIEDATIQTQLDRLARIKAANEEAEKQEALKNWKPEAIKEATSFDDFCKMDIRVATVLDCQPVKKSDRLLQFRLDDGMGGRTILSGIAQSYPDPSVLVGKQILFIPLLLLVRREDRPVDFYCAVSYHYHLRAVALIHIGSPLTHRIHGPYRPVPPYL